VDVGGKPGFVRHGAVQLGKLQYEATLLHVGLCSYPSCKSCFECWGQTVGCAANAQTIQTAVEQTMSISAYLISAASQKADLRSG